MQHSQRKGAGAIGVCLVPMEAPRVVGPQKQWLTYQTSRIMKRDQGDGSASKGLASKPDALSWILRMPIILSVTYTCAKLKNSVQRPVDLTNLPLLDFTFSSLTDSNQGCWFGVL